MCIVVAQRIVFMYIYTMKKVAIYKAYKYRLYPNKAQCLSLSQTFGCVRYVYNWALDKKQSAYRESNESLSITQLSRDLTLLKQETDKLWLNDVLRIPLTQALRNLNTAFNRFFKGQAGKPKFKSKYARQSAYYRHNDFCLIERGIKLQKIDGDIKVNYHRPLPKECEIRSATVSKDTCGRYFVSISVIETIAQLKPLKAKIGIDLGINHFAITSDGDKIANPRVFDSLYKKLIRTQRVLSRRKKGSKNRDKARLKVAKIHSKIANVRRNFQHKLSKMLIDENQAIGVESLKIQNMLKNRRLSRAIADVSWGQFVSFLCYKADWYGRDIVKLDTFYPSSKTCSLCGHKVDDMPLHVRVWTCPECFTEHDRDINAAINVRNNTVGMPEIYACGVHVRPASIVATHKEARNILVA